jgi:V8-like Glu-specific endopeptidase
MRTALVMATFMLMGLPVTAQEEANNVPLDDGVVLELPEAEQIHYPPAALPALGPVIWQRVFEEEGRRFVRLEIAEIQAPAGADYQVIIRNSRAERVFVYGPERFTRGSFWTGVIPGDTALLEVRAAVPPEGLRFTIRRVALEQEGQTMLSIIEPSDFEPVYKLESPDLVWASGVAKLSFIRAGKAKTCTGFLVAEDLLLTNEHCVNTQEICRTAVALFGYQEKEDGSFLHGAQYECMEHKGGQYERDFALLRLDGEPGADARWTPLRLCDRAISAGDELVVIQHPSGRPKEFVDGCRVKKDAVQGRRNVVETVDLSHDCDTERGSSGSPVLDARRDVVGLHHLGFGRGDFKTVNRAVRVNELLPLVGVAPQCSGAGDDLGG